MATHETKRCLGCRRDKEIDEFAKHGAEPDGRQKVCRKCQRLRRLVYNRTPKGKEARLAYDHSKYGQQRRYRWCAKRATKAMR